MGSRRPCSTALVPQSLQNSDIWFGAALGYLSFYEASRSLATHAVVTRRVLVQAERFSTIESVQANNNFSASYPRATFGLGRVNWLPPAGRIVRSTFLKVTRVCQITWRLSILTVKQRQQMAYQPRFPSSDAITSCSTTERRMTSVAVLEPIEAHHRLRRLTRPPSARASNLFRMTRQSAPSILSRSSIVASLASQPSWPDQKLISERALCRALSDGRHVVATCQQRGPFAEVAASWPESSLCTWVNTSIPAHISPMRHWCPSGRPTCPLEICQQVGPDGWRSERETAGSLQSRGRTGTARKNVAADRTEIEDWDVRRVETPGRFDTAEELKSRRGRQGNPPGAEDCSTPELKPLLTVADTPSAHRSFAQAEKFATIPARTRSANLLRRAVPTRRRKWGPHLRRWSVPPMSGGALMLMGPPIESAQDAYRSAVAEIQRLSPGRAPRLKVSRGRPLTKAWLRKRAKCRGESCSRGCGAGMRKRSPGDRGESHGRGGTPTGWAEARAAAQKPPNARRPREGQGRGTPTGWGWRASAAREAANARRLRKAKAEARHANRQASASRGAGSAKRQAAERRAKAGRHAKRLRLKREPRRRSRQTPGGWGEGQRSAAARQPAEPKRAAAQKRQTPGALRRKPRPKLWVQTRLEALDEAQPTDGILGSRTIGAIKRYWNANGLRRPETLTANTGTVFARRSQSQADRCRASRHAFSRRRCGPDVQRRLEEAAGRRHADAERGFKAFLQSNPRHQLAGNAQYWLGGPTRHDYQNAICLRRRLRGSRRARARQLADSASLRRCSPQAHARAVRSTRNIRAPSTRRSAGRAGLQKNGCGWISGHHHGRRSDVDSATA